MDTQQESKKPKARSTLQFIAGQHWSMQGRIRSMTTQLVTIAQTVGANKEIALIASIERRMLSKLTDHTNARKAAFKSWQLNQAKIATKQTNKNL